MKFNKLGRNTLAAGLSAAMAFGLSACSRDYIAAYVYATSKQNSTITAYAVDYQSGILTQIAGSPFSTGDASNTITAIPSPNNKFLYVVGGGPQSASVQPMSIGTDGKLYGLPAKTMAALGTYPTAAAVDSTGTFLLVTYQYQNGSGPSSPGPGGLSIFPIDSDAKSATFGQLKDPINVPLDVNPVGVTVTVPVSTANNAVYVYVAEQTQPGTRGTVREFQMNTASGALTALGSFQAAVTPSAIITEPTGRFVYLSDQASNQIYEYQLSSTGGTLTPINGGPANTGLFPVSMTVDPRGKYLYVANYNSNTISGYTINHATGALGGIVGTSSFTTATGPTCVTVDPAIGIYLYTSNYLDGSVSGGQVTPEDGTVKAVANTPFPASALPSCITSVANGSHASSLVNPN